MEKRENAESNQKSLVSEANRFEININLLNSEIKELQVRMQRVERELFRRTVIRNQTKAISQDDSLPKKPECTLYNEAKAKSPVRPSSNLEKIIEPESSTSMKWLQ